MSISSAPPPPEELVRMVTENPLLSSIDRTHLVGLKDELEWVPLSAGTALFREGDGVDAFYFLIRGRLEVTTLQEDLDGNPDNDRLVLAEIGPGETIGEMQILTGGTRSATVTAREDSGLIKFSKEAFDRFLATDPRVVDELSKTIMPRLYRDQMVDVLPKLFGELDEGMLHDLEKKMRWVHLRRGMTLFEQGASSDSFYIIISGRLQALITDAAGRMRMVGEMSQGESVGEMGVFTDEPRSATVVASRDSELLEFSKTEFDEFTAQYPQLMRRMTQLLIKRLQLAHRETTVPTLSMNIMLAPGGADVPLDQFAARLFDALSELDSCLMLTSERVDSLLGRTGIAQADEREPDDLRLRSWLNQQEKKYRFIVFQTDVTATDWTRRCIRQADEIMYVATASGTPDLTDVELEVDRLERENQTSRRRTLTLLHPDGSARPSGTIHWLEKRDADRHFHVRMDTREDFLRVARFVTGRAVGLVLSGGGARGFAHVGIIRAMKELGVPIDMIGGVSMGCLVSAAYAFSDDFEAMIDTTKAQLKGAMNDYTIPVVSIARGGRFDKRIKFLFGNVNIEDLWTPFFCVSSNLTQADIVVHETGPLWRAVRASGSLPGIVPPVIENGDLLYDGCLLDNLPMDVMRDKLGKATVIAVDVVPPVDLSVEVSNIESPSGWRLLWNKLNPFAERIDLPNIVSIIHRAGELGSVYGRQRLIDKQIADVYLRPPVESFQILDFSTVNETAQIGYDFGKQELQKWRATQ